MKEPEQPVWLREERDAFLKAKAANPSLIAHFPNPTTRCLARALPKYFSAFPILVKTPDGVFHKV